MMGEQPFELSVFFGELQTSFDRGWLMCGYLSLATKMGLWQKISKLRFGEDFERIHHRWVWPWHMCTFGLWKEPKWMKIVSFLTGVSSSFPDIEFCTRHDLCESSPWPWYFWCPSWENWWQCPFAAQLFGSQRQTAHKACRWRVSQAPNAVWNPSFFGWVFAERDTPAFAKWFACHGMCLSWYSRRGPVRKENLCNASGGFYEYLLLLRSLRQNLWTLDMR